MNRISSARAITGLATYFGSVIRHKHVHEVFRIAQIVVRIYVRMAAAVAIGVGRQRGHLGDQADNLALPGSSVANVPRLRIHVESAASVLTKIPMG